jgi:hypothetical protein
MLQSPPPNLVDRSITCSWCGLGHSSLLRVGHSKIKPRRRVVLLQLRPTCLPLFLISRRVVFDATRASKSGGIIAQDELYFPSRNLQKTPPRKWIKRVLEASIRSPWLKVAMTKQAWVRNFVPVLWQKTADSNDVEC